MSKTKNLLIGILLTMALLASVLCGTLFVSADDSAAGTITNSDFTQIGTGVTASPDASDNTKTDVTLQYGASHMVYGTATAEGTIEPYYVDFGTFRWDLTIEQMAPGQALAVSFLKDASTAPFEEGAQGVTFIFEYYNDSLIFAVVDSATGEAIPENADSVTGSMWGNYTDDQGYRNGKGGSTPYKELLEQYPALDGEGEEFCHGMMGFIGGTPVGRTLSVLNVIDGASFGGSTARPGYDGGWALGSTVAGNCFSKYDMKKEQAVLVLSACEGIVGSVSETEPSTDPIRVTVSTPDEANTDDYLESDERLAIVEEIPDYAEQVDAALAGTLPAEDYTALREAVQKIDLSDLRPRDQYVYQSQYDAFMAKLADLDERMQNVPGAVQDYAEAIAKLDPLSEVTQENLTAAREARETYQLYASYVKYLTGTELEKAEAAIASLDERFLVRAEAHLQIQAFEAAVAVFDDAPASATVEQIYAAEQARKAIDFDGIETLDEADQTAFDDRIAAADATVTEARTTAAYAVEQYKLTQYNAAIATLSDKTDLASFQSVYDNRPTMVSEDITDSTQKTEIENAYAAADEAFGAEIARVIGGWATTYEAAVAELADLASLNRSKINAAEDAEYSQSDLEGMLAIADGIGYETAELEARLQECDRAVLAAKTRILATEFNSLATGEIADTAALQAAYDAYTAAAGADLADLSETEKTAYNEMLTEATAAYNDKAEALFETAVGAFEAAVEAEGFGTTTESVDAAKNARAAVPSFSLLIDETARTEFEERYNTANTTLMDENLYWAYSTGSSWTISSSEDGVQLGLDLNGTACDGIAAIEESLPIDGFDFAFEFTQPGRIWTGEGGQIIYVLNIMRTKGSWKEQAPGFSIYMTPNHVNQLEVLIYGAQGSGASAGENLLAQGNVEGMTFAPEEGEEYVPQTVRIRIEMDQTCYNIWINSLQLSVYYRQILNPAESSPAHLPGYDEGVEVGDKLFENGEAYASFIVFANGELTQEEGQATLTVRMIGDKTFGDYVPPVYMTELKLISGPTKTEYKKGEEFDKTGIVMQAVMSDGTTVDIDLDDIQVLGFNTTSRGQKNVTLRYTDESGVTLSKVIQVTVVDDETDNPGTNPGGNNGDGWTWQWAALFVPIGVVVIAGAVVAFIFLKKKNAKSAADAEESKDDKEE